MAGIDARTGQPLDGFAHVVQSLGKIFTTEIGERIMREWFGAPGNRLMGELLTERTIMRWWTVTWMSIELFEPRFRARRLIPIDATRAGEFALIIEGEHRPYAHLDWEQARILISLSDSGITVSAAT